MKVFRSLLLIGLAGAMFAACSKRSLTDIPEPVVPEDEAQVVLSSVELSVPGMAETIDLGEMQEKSTSAVAREAISVSLPDAVTRAGDTSATPAECKVNKVWVFQFNDSGKLVYKQDFSDPFKGGTTSSLDVALYGYDSSTIYAVANVPDAKFTDALMPADATAPTYAIADFEKVVFETASEISVDSGLPMAGSWTGQTKDASLGTPQVSLKRLVAKVSFTCKTQLPTGHSFTLKSVQLCSASPQAPLKAPVATAASPASTVAFFDYAAKTAAVGTTYTWYVLENQRGTVAGITSPLDKGDAKAPKGSTYIQVIGTYNNGAVAADVSFHVYPGANTTSDFNIARNTKYTVTATIKGNNPDDDRVIVATDLCKDPWDNVAYANCYMVSKAGCTYKFNATVQGNGKNTAQSTCGSQTAPAISAVTMTPKSVKVLWETTGAQKIIKNVELKSDGWVYFTTAGDSGAATEGNALIAVYSTETPGGTNNVLWSWHIWSTSYDPNADGQLDEYITRTNTATTANPYKMMKRNLGAGSNTQGQLSSYGLLYQWGRKDPFIGANGTSSTTAATTYGTAWPAAVAATATTSGTGSTNMEKSIDFAVKNPMTFITQVNTTTYDWVNAPAVANQRDNLWGNPNTSASTPTTSPLTVNRNMTKKSKYDPCPPGYSVPPQDTWTYFTNTGNNVTSGAPTGCNVSGGFNLGWNFYYKSGAAVYYPAAGLRHRESGALTLVGTEGVYWSSSSYGAGSNNAGSLRFRSSNVYPLSNPYRAHGFSVRCVQNNQ